jgi:hypothetical protein
LFVNLNDKRILFPEKVLALQKRFRRVYLAFYKPLLDGRESAEDWQMVITYGQEVLACCGGYLTHPLTLT